MASIDRYRPPPREGYQPPVVPTKNTTSPTKSRREVPPAVPSPPNHSSRTSPPRPHSGHSAPSPSQPSQQGTPSMRRKSASDQWFFTQDEVLSSPSILDGLSPAEERLRRAKGVNFIVQTAVLLDLPQTTQYVAGLFFHRFYMRNSMVEEKGGVHHYNIAATALFLANKTEENCRKTKDIIIAVAKVAQKNAKLIIDEQNKEYWRWRDNILMYEEVMLEQLTFDLMVTNPHVRLYEYLGKLGVIHNKLLRHAAWAFCSDAALTILPLLMEAKDIAVASVFFSSIFTGERIEDVNGEAWWKSLNGNEEDLVKAIEVLRAFYTENPLRKQENPYQGSPEFSLEHTRRVATASQGGSSANDTPQTDIETPRNGVPDAESKERDEEAAAVEAVSSVAPGDSDAILKEAANDPAIHPVHSNGDGLLSPGTKRKELAVVSEDDKSRDQKRRRTSSDISDEGEVHE